MALEHWRYFLALEQDLEATTRYVEPTPANAKTYSIEFARLLLAFCSEVDVVAKVLCERVAPGTTVRNIDDYRTAITGRYPKFHSIKIHVPRFSLVVEPWKSWAGQEKPSWWRDHNRVKHMRHQDFALANLNNCVGAATGLFSLVSYLYQKELFAMLLHPAPVLLRLEKQPDRLVVGAYELPDFPAGAA